VPLGSSPYWPSAGLRDRRRDGFGRIGGLTAGLTVLMTVAVVIGLLVGLTLRRQPVDAVVADKS
jgi:Na+/H+-dicarboxylate symporter